MRMCRLVAWALLIAGSVGCGDDDSAPMRDRDGGISLPDGAAPPPPVDSGTTTPPPPPPPERDGGTPPPPNECGGDERRGTLIYNGTRMPTALPLTQGQVYAVGHLDGSCSATAIGGNWVLTAKHCGARSGSRFCVGIDPEDPSTCLRVDRAINNPEGDMTLLELERDPATALPELEPVLILTEDMNDSWLNRTAEAAGYGQQEDGGFGEREFSAEPIVSLRGDTMTIDGQGVRGVCFGDSGGPVMVLATDGSVRVAGALSNGDNSCLGRDNYTRVDVYREWIESYTGPTPDPGGGCGTLGAEGRCLGDQASWCEDDERGCGVGG